MTEATLQQSPVGSDEREYLSFVLGKEYYAIDITTVKEIRGYEATTKIANAPAFIKGVLNLRGDIVPIVDLRIKFDVGEPTYNEFTIVIMLHVYDRIVGVVVDGVSDVVRLTEAEVFPPPEFGVAFDSQYLLGLEDVDDSMVILVNIEKLITSDALALVDNSQSAAIAG